ncbi:unnamed protein product [Spirodela intermedia]|uniref:Bidirectional sugar transporter SWEET n=1 Tax=Spirodela intermedia TaxID=51605 RepID=A0A7I8JT78_SPIIN|nr:unnamed protein product [Spirodela intermedia]CAA6672975.1 unnamed protein product [Spirodela intermedia]
MVSAGQARTVVGILGNTVSLGLFLSPVPTFAAICRNKSVEQFSPAPYLASLLNCMLWVLYGLPCVHPHSTLVLTINATGAAVELAYRLRVLATLLAELLFVVAAAAIVLTLAHTHQRRSLVIGSLCVFFGTLMYAAPLSVMKLVLETKSVEFLPLGLSLASFLNGVCWTSYALIRFDLFITIPNSLALHAVFYKSTREKMAERRRGADGTGSAEVVVNGDAEKVGPAPPNPAAPLARDSREVKVSEDRVGSAPVDFLQNYFFWGGRFQSDVLYLRNNKPSWFSYLSHSCQQFKTSDQETKDGYLTKRNIDFIESKMNRLILLRVL